MYVKPTTTTKEIEKKIMDIKRELESDRLLKEDREALHEELSYLESFLPVERW